MSEQHLKKGSLQPPKLDNKLRLYSMRYCPFAQRVRMVLLVKKIPHDIVNVDIFNKPEWLFTLNPLGQVPILDTGSRIISESLEICVYLDKEYPEPHLYAGNDRYLKLAEDFNEILPIFYEMAKTQNNKSYDEHMSILLPLVMKYEIELQNNGGLYFGGTRSHLLDYMLWPFAERAGLCSKPYGKNIPESDVFPRLHSWCSARLLPEVQLTKTNLEYQGVIFEQLMDNDYNINFDIV
ncbi:hypothetical protein FQR65_LT12097 [Abscondita terminalis]|nr:hypothetical protein FQR65_LT12097 [Abscondita terminalis]